MKLIFKTGIFFLLGIGAVKAQTGANCQQALPFCTDINNYDFPNSTGVPSLGNVSCLSSTPNPVWYYMQVAQTGNINIFISQANANGSGLDVDFAVWGPFVSLAAGCGNPFPPGTPVDCSYSTSATETAHIPNAPAGQYYIMLITNYSNQAGNIHFSQTNVGNNGAGATNCGILAAGSSNGPICAGQTLLLTANQVVGGTYQWTGPNGFSSTLQNPVIPNATVANAGTYTLVVTDPSGTDTALVNVVVNPKPTAALSTNPLVCLGTASVFSAAGSQPVPGITSYQWIFNNSGVINQTTNVPTATFTYPIAGTYNTAVVVTAAGCKDTARFQVIVSPKPTASFTMPAQSCEEKPVTLDASASAVAAPGLISEYRWDFNNDGTIDQTVPSPVLSHSFSQGTHAVKLTVSTNAGCTASDLKNIQVYDYPETAFEFNTPCLGGVTQFTNLTPPTTPAATYNWDFGYGIPGSTSTNPSVVFPGLGTRDITLIATVGGLCSDTLTKQQVIEHDVQAAFSFNGPCGFDGIFTDASFIPTDATGTINGWAWSFGDGGLSTDQNPTHTYQVNNINQVTLVVSTAEGCFDTLTQQVPKYAIPVAAFSAPNVCLNAHTLYIDSSTVSSGHIQSWLWSFGEDSAVSMDAVPIHTYDTTGTYPLVLVVTTENGCSDTAYGSTQVYPNPIAAFATVPPNSTTLLEPDVIFGDASIGAVSWLWTVVGQGTSNEQKPIWTFTSTGTYLIDLVVTNEYGCTDEAKQDFVVTPAYNFFAPGSFTPQNGDNLNAYWRVYTMGMREIKLSIFNRWGELLYSTEDPLFMWDGKYHGKQLPADQYIYKADTRDIEGKQYQYLGSILLLQ